MEAHADESMTKVRHLISHFFHTSRPPVYVPIPISKRPRLPRGMPPVDLPHRRPEQYSACAGCVKPCPNETEEDAPADVASYAVN
jgi:hypothetical protein